MNTDPKPAELRLVNGTDTIVIRPRSAGGLDPIMCKQWDLGSPEMRYTSVANPGADGVTYSEGFTGSRTVTLDLAILGGRDPITGLSHDAYWYANKLTQMAHPKALPVLQITRDDEINAGATWSMDLRGSPYSLPYSSRSASLLELQLTFTCPLGLIEGPLLCFTTPAPDDTGDTDLDMPFMLPFTFGLTGAKYPHITMEVGGDSMVTPMVYISGPVTNPDLRMDDGDRFAFKGLTLPVGQTVQIDMGAGTVRLGDADTGMVTDDMGAYNQVDWAVSSFWQWQPGTHTLLYRNTTGNVTVQYRERRLTI
jgi:hypothetical protein